MANDIPNRIDLRILADGEPIEGLLCMVISGADYKSSFSLVAGPSDASGILHVTREAIIASAQEKLKLNSRSEGTELENLSAKFTVFPMDLARLKSAKQASKTLRQSYHFPRGYDESIDNAIAVLSQHPATTLTVEVVSVDGEGTVKTQSIKPV
jgi:hypothetical protein